MIGTKNWLADSLFDANRPLGYVHPFWVRFALVQVAGDSFPHPDESEGWRVPTANEEARAIEWLRANQPAHLKRVPASLLA